MNYIDTARYELEDKSNFERNDWILLTQLITQNLPKATITLKVNNGKVSVHVTSRRIEDIVDLLPYKPEYIDIQSQTVSYIPCPQSN